MRFRALGTLEIIGDDGDVVELGGAQPRLVVAVLLAAGGRVVTPEALIDTIWGEGPPASATGTLQSYVSRLRHALEPGRGPRAAPTVLVREPTGYRLAVAPEDVDFLRFEHLAELGRGQLVDGDPERARVTLVEADELWRGSAFAEHRELEFARGLATRLEERRAAAVEDRVAADLALGRHDVVIAELTELVDAHPLREGLRAHLALALYRSGRQADALRALDDARRTLRDELGVEPSRRLRELDAAILAQDPALDAPARLAAPVPAGPTDRAVATSAPAARAGGLIGRTAEIAALEAALDESATGARTVIVEGEPGIGKTALAEELGRRAAERGALVLWGRAFEGGASPAYWPWLPPLRALAAAAPPGTAPAPELLALVSASPSAGVGSGGVDTTAFSIVDAVARLVELVATARPIVLVVDDVQWADTASLELLAALPGRVAGSPLLLIVTSRELDVGRNDDVVSTLATLTRATGARRLALRGLGPDESRALVARAAGDAVDAEAAAAVYGRAEGNPFYTTELARLLAEGHLNDVPSGVRDVVRRRIGQLAPPSLELLQVAAVVGRDVDINLLTRAAGSDLASCLDALEPALVQRLVVAADARPGTYRFAHALVREVVADDLSPLHRARLHVQVADALGDDDDSAEILAEHLWAAVPIGVGSRAAVALERAAHVAIGRLAYRAALDLLERAVHLRRVGGPDPDDPDGELRVIALLVAVIGAHKGYPALLDSPHVARGKVLAARRGQSAAREAFALTWAEWAALDVTCQFDRADPIAAELLEAAAGVEIPLARALAHTAAGISAWHHGRIVEAADHLDRAAAIGVEIEPSASLSMLFDVDQLRLAAPFSVYVHDLMGDHVDPRAAYERLVRQSPGGHWESLVLTFAASGAITTGDVERAIEAARRGVALDPDRVAAFWTSQLIFYLGAALCLAGRFDEGDAIFDDGRRACHAVGQRTNTTTIVCARAIGLSFAGRADEAREATVDARELLERDRERHAEPNVMLAEALVQLADGDRGAANATLEAAAALAEAQGSRAVAARVRRDAARAGIHVTGP